MKKTFELPELEILAFSVEDIITSSNVEGLPEVGDNMGDWA